MIRIVTSFLILLTLRSFSQNDSIISAPLVGIHLSGQLPGGDLVKRFGPSISAGGAFLYKTDRNWIVGIESAYFFGEKIKEDVTSQMKTADGFIIENQGFPADLRLTQRGINVHLVFGRILNVLSPNPNSGVLVMFGAGYLEHKINFYDPDRRVAAVNGNLVYGYDRLSNGFSLTQFVGYLYLGENRFSNFYFGFECYEAFTKSVRRQNYDTGKMDTKQRLDILTGFRAGWILPLYQRTPHEFYFN